MSYKATNWAWELPLRMPEKFVLVALADMADEQHSCYPGQATLSAMTGASERTVRRALVKLEEDGLITREERRKEGGYRTSDRYVLQVGTPVGHYRSDWPVGESHRSESPISPVTQSILTGQSDRYIEEEPPENHQGTTSGPRKRGTRIPDPFVLTADMKVWGSAEVPGLDLVAHTREFVDHFRAASGTNATKRDWVAAWRNWMRRAHRSTPRSQTFAQQKQHNMLDLVGRAQEEERHAQIGNRDAAGLLSIGRGA